MGGITGNETTSRFGASTATSSFIAWSACIPRISVGMYASAHPRGSIAHVHRDRRCVHEFGCFVRLQSESGHRRRKIIGAAPIDGPLVVTPYTKSSASSNVTCHGPREPVVQSSVPTPTGLTTMSAGHRRVQCSPDVGLFKDFRVRFIFRTAGGSGYVSMGPLRE